MSRNVSLVVRGRACFLCAVLGSVLLPAVALGASDFTVRPTQGASPTKAVAGSSANTASVCLVPCGADFLDPSSHFDCKPSGPNAVTDHTVTVNLGQGNVCVRAVAISDQGVVSDPSNSKTVQDTGTPPEITE